MAGRDLCPEPCLQLSAQVQTLMNKLISIQNTLSCLPHSFIKKQSYGAPYLLIWSLDLSVVSSVFYFWFYSTSAQTAKCPDPLMGRHHIPLHLLLLTETSLTRLNLLLQWLFHLMLIHEQIHSKHGLPDESQRIPVPGHKTHLLSVAVLYFVTC